MPCYCEHVDPAVGTQGYPVRFFPRRDVAGDGPGSGLDRRDRAPIPVGDEHALGRWLVNDGAEHQPWPRVLRDLTHRQSHQ
jgi:hypothetical protein